MSTPHPDNLSAPSNFYRDYLGFLILLISLIIIMLGMGGFVLYQIKHRPVPLFYAKAPDGQLLPLVARDEPNYLPGTLTRWASKAAVSAYTFDFANTNRQLALARPYFTQAGWDAYRNSISGLLASIKANQVFVNGVVVGPPVITNEGDFTDHGYAWRIQLPFLVTTQSAEVTVQKNYTLILTIVKVPTDINPVGIGIDQFVMR